MSDVWLLALQIIAQIIRLERKSLNKKLLETEKKGKRRALSGLSNKKCGEGGVLQEK